MSNKLEEIQLVINQFQERNRKAELMVNRNETKLMTNVYDRNIKKN